MDNDINAMNSTAPEQITAQPPYTTPQAPPPAQRSKSPIIITALLILAIGTGVGGYFYGKSLQSNDNSSKIFGVAPANWQPLPSSKKGFPIEADNKEILTFYSLDENKVISVDSVQLSKNSSSGSSGKGTGAALASPSLHHITFIGSDGNLWLFSVETQQTKQLTTNGLVSYITEWSPDSKNILYYYDLKTIANSSWGIDAPPAESVSFKPQVEQGFYQVNIETGQVTPLAPIERAEGYIDNDTLLVHRDANDGEQLVAFEINTLEANLAAIDTRASFGVSQFEFSSDGKKWAFLNPVDKAEPTKGQTQIVLGDYPKVSTVVDSGSWADVQRPMFSSDNKKIAYQKRIGTTNGIAQNQVWVYELDSGAKKSVGEGSIMHWIDEAAVLVRTSRDQTGQTYSILNIETGESKAI